MNLKFRKKSFLFSSSYTKHRHIFVDRAWESCESGEVFTPTSPRRLYANARKIEDELFSDYSSKAFKAGLTVKKKIETLGKDSIGTSASPEKRILLEESVDCSSNDLSLLVTSTPVKAVRNASVRKIQIPPLSPVRPPIMERSEGNDSGTENKTVLS